MSPSPSSDHELVSPLTSDSLVRHQDGVVLRTVAGEHMLVPTVTREVDLDSLFLLNETGVFIWKQLDKPQRVGDLGQLLAREFSIAPEVAATDVDRFLSSLIGRKLAQRMGEHGN